MFFYQNFRAIDYMRHKTVQYELWFYVGWKILFKQASNKVAWRIHKTLL